MTGIPKTTFDSDRSFELWHYRAFHWQFLLRSTPRAAGEENIDIIFKGVTFVQIEPGLIGISIRPANNLERTSFCGKRILFPSNRLFVLESQGHLYWVVAASFAVYANNLSPSDIPLDALNDDDEIPAVRLGRLLAADSGHNREKLE